MADSAPEVLLLQPKDGMQATLLEDLYKDLIAKIGERFRTSSTDYRDAADLFAEGKPSVVLAVDGVLSAKKYTNLHQQLAQYTKNGGTVIFCCLFSSFCRPNDVARLFTAFDLKWKSGDYHRTSFTINGAFRSAVDAQLFPDLETIHSVKALHLKHVPCNARVYAPTSGSRTQSHVFPPDPVDQSQSPAVFTRCGRGFIGYLGDVNNEVGTQTLLFAMIETALKSAEQESTSTELDDTQSIRPVSFNPGCFVCDEKQPVKKCGTCHTEQYCSARCQKAAWNEHKEVCNKPTYDSGEEDNDDEEMSDDGEEW